MFINKHLIKTFASNILKYILRFLRWEDEVKKEVPVPECLNATKDPSGYTDEDVAAVRVQGTSSARRTRKI